MPHSASPPPSEEACVRRPSRRSLLVLAWGVSLLGLVMAVAVEVLGPLARWEVSLRDQAGQLSVSNSSPEGGFFGLPVEMGDYDGDGNVDLTIAPMAAPSGPAHQRSRGGEVYVYRGTRSIEGLIDRKAMAGAPAGLTVWGARADDFLGTELYSADVNGDGIQDLLLSAQNYDGPSGNRNNCGGAFVVLGRPGLLGQAPGEGVTIDLAQPPEGVITITGRQAGDRLGIWVEAGDLDGDRIADILVGADQARGADSPAREHAGMVAVIYGRRQFPASIDLARVGNQAGETPDVSFIYGRDAEDHFGSCLHARDLDRDGRDELIAAAALNRLSASYGGADAQFPSHAAAGADGPENLREECGEVQVIFSAAGEASRLPPVLDLAAPPAGLAERITTIYGEKRNEAAGEELATGDFNGDGFPDLVLGALTATNPDGRLEAGAARILYWAPGLAGKVIDLSAPQGFPAGLVLSNALGLKTSDILGDTLSSGDFNHDGFDDLAVGIPHHSVDDALAQAGEVAIIYGRAEPLPPRFFPDLPDPALRVTYVIGARRQDFLSYSMEARDYDGDGYTDLFPNAMRGNGVKNDTLDAGEAYLISGWQLSGGRLAVEQVIPPGGPLEVEVPVVIAGAGFTLDRETKVFAGGVEATGVRVLSGDRISCRLPARSAEAVVPVAVQNRYGSSTLPDAFHYQVAPVFVRGDSNADQVLELSDAVATLDFLFFDAPTGCADARDTNDDGEIDISDPIFTLFTLFGGGPPPPPPYPGAGPDPTPDALGCE